MKQLLEEIQVDNSQPTPIYYDNTSAISNSKNLVMHSKTKHISIKYHFLREQFSEQKVKLEYVNTNGQIVDIFTKPFPKDKFIYLW